MHKMAQTQTKPTSSITLGADNKPKELWRRETVVVAAYMSQYSNIESDCDFNQKVNALILKNKNCILSVTECLMTYKKCPKAAASPVGHSDMSLWDTGLII